MPYRTDLESSQDFEQEIKQALSPILEKYDLSILELVIYCKHSVNVLENPYITLLEVESK